jgi:hypothetical protein
MKPIKKSYIADFKCMSTLQGPEYANWMGFYDEDTLRDYLESVKDDDMLDYFLRLLKEQGYVLLCQPVIPT